MGVNRANRTRSLGLSAWRHHQYLVVSLDYLDRSDPAAPNPRVCSSKVATREGVKDTRKTAPMALLAFASAIRSKGGCLCAGLVFARVKQDFVGNAPFSTFRQALAVMHVQ